MNNKRLTKQAFILGLAFLSQGALAASDAAVGDAVAGRSKALACMGCHAIEGYSNAYPNYSVPRLGGQHAAYIVAALKAYKTGLRKHQTMVAQASSLSAQDMQDIAAYFSAITQ